MEIMIYFKIYMKFELYNIVLLCIIKINVQIQKSNAAFVIVLN